MNSISQQAPPTPPSRPAGVVGSVKTLLAASQDAAYPPKRGWFHNASDDAASNTWRALQGGGGSRGRSGKEGGVKGGRGGTGRRQSAGQAGGGIALESLPRMDVVVVTLRLRALLPLGLWSVGARLWAAENARGERRARGLLRTRTRPT